MVEFVDTHTHIFEPEFNDDRSAVVERALASGVSKLCLPCITAESIERISAMCHSFPGVCYGMMGLHPTEVGDDYRSVLDSMYCRLKSDDSYIAIGEVGIDLYWDTARKTEQIDAFSRQIEWSVETGLPLVIHSRNAFNEIYSIMESNRHRGLRGVFHCFSGTEEEACKLLSFDGFYLGIGGVLTYKKSTLPAVLKSVPLDRLLLETDSPYLAPVPYRGKRNESAYVPYVAQALAAIYDVSVEEVAAITTKSACELFPKIV